jgi:DNA-binding NarL/FixJ family response regulator
MSVRVLITDESPAIRDAIRRNLECIGCEIVAEAATTEQALTLFRTVHPEIVTLGVDLAYSEEANPLHLIHLIKREAPRTSVLMIAGALPLLPHDAEMFKQAGALACFVAPFEFASLWQNLSRAHPELMAGAFATMMSATAAVKASRALR